MLNMKKGLAIVLAAATALTFAPVANLGVSAYAAASTVEQTLTIPAAAYTTAGTTEVNVAPSDSQPGYTEIKPEVAADGMVIKGLQVSTKDTATTAWFKISGISGSVDSVNNISTKTLDSTATTKYFKDTTTPTPSTTGLAVNQYVKSTSGKIDLGDIYLHAGGKSVISLVDVSATDGENINITINADQNKQTTPAATLTGTKFATRGATVTAETSAINPQSSTYFLDLNKYDPGYLLYFANNSDGVIATPGTTSVDGLSYTNWAGSTVVVKNIKLKNANRSIQWATVDTSNGAAVGTKFAYSTNDTVELAAKPNATPATTKYTYDDASTIGNVYNSGLNPNGVIFKTTAATAGTDSIAVTFSGSNGGSVSTSVRFSTDRSEASVDAVYATVGNTTTTLTPNSTTGEYSLTGIDAQINNSGKVVVKSESGDYRFISVDPSIITIDEKSGEFKVLKKGSTKIQVYVGSTVNNKPTVKTINVTVSPWATDSISITSDANVEYYTLSNVNYLDLDVPDSKAANAVKSAQLKAVSAGGLETKWTSSDTSVVTVDEKTGLVTAKKAGSATLTVSTSNSIEKEIWGTTNTVKVTVWNLPASVFTVAPVTVNVGDSTLVAPVVTSPKNYTYTVNYDNQQPEQYSLTNPGAVNNNTQTSSRITGKKIGTANVLVTVLGTSENRPTTRKATVTVLDKTAVNVITMDAGSQSLVLKEGETAQLKGTASIKGKTVTFQNGDTSIATVTTAGAVTAVKAGQTTVKAVSDGAETVEIPVVVVAKVNTPAQVTGVKVANVKGGKVKVTWTKDANSNVKYYVKKTVSGKSAGKSVGSNATTLTVKKGATVKVKVKAYVYDGANKLVGAYSTTVTKKTDKK
ncbi:MAG: Ig-like domain-containing protein [Lachnospiraceae bacterium]|nr:Ig-like domain-containing protein [Lachnospiraceae bacterium]MDD7664822.1 Ig-like domain-containing protein [Lachnospiraceae bacterium]MDY4164699.1 Ig-like domain-containing protein [Lachnospiraceae bacterium]